MIDKKEEYLRKLMQDENGISIISQKLETILTDKDFYKYDLLIPIIEKLIQSGHQRDILENFELILNKALTDETLDILTIISKAPEGKKILKNNINIIFLKLDGEDVIDFIDLLEEKDKKDILQKNQYAYELYKKELIRQSTLGGIIKGDLSDFVKEIIKEVSEGKSLKKLEEGTYNDTIETNGYVIKLGQTRDKYEIPYHPNILQPLLRERVKDKAGNDILIVEVQDKVDTKNVTQKQREELIKKLEKSKIKCSDILYGNIGILLKKNKRRLFNGVGGIKDHKDIKEETLNPGEPVIFDTDMIEKIDENR